MKDPRVRFDLHSPFALELERRVEAYMGTPGLDRVAARAMRRKTAALFGLLAIGLATAIIGSAWAFIVLGALLAGLAMAGLGMSVMHDGGHRAYSRNPTVNLAAASVLDFLGASSWVWRHKHGVAHHTYPNIEGADEDIELRPFARMAPGQPHAFFHRWQHIYLLPLYCFINVKWFWYDDYRDLVRGRIGSTSIRRPRGRDLAIFVVGKLVHLAWAVVLPLAVLGLAKGLVFHFTMYFVCGFTLALVFQLAHCVEEAEFVELPAGAASDPVRLDFAVHQLATTVDFARDNALLGWYVGGLNFQAVHHLYPRVNHVHYPALAEIVERCCIDHGVTYKHTPSLLRAVRSHLRWLRRMGAGEPAPVRVPTALRPAAPPPEIALSA